MSVEWTDQKIEAAKLILQGVAAGEVIKQTKLSKSWVYLVKKELNKGKMPPGMEKPAPALVKKDGQGVPKSKTTDAVSQTAFIQFVPYTQQVVMAPDIFLSYMYALRRNFKGSLGDWIALTCRDFWIGREINFYEEVTGVASPSG